MRRIFTYTVDLDDDADEDAVLRRGGRALGEAGARVAAEMVEPAEELYRVIGVVKGKDESWGETVRAANPEQAAERAKAKAPSGSQRTIAEVRRAVDPT